MRSQKSCIIDTNHEHIDLFEQHHVTGIEIRFIRTGKLMRFNGSNLSLTSDWLLPVSKEELDDERGTHPKYEPVSRSRTLELVG